MGGAQSKDLSHPRAAVARSARLLRTTAAREKSEVLRLRSARWPASAPLRMTRFFGSSAPPGVAPPDIIATAGKTPFCERFRMTRFFGHGAEHPREETAFHFQR